MDQQSQHRQPNIYFRSDALLTGLAGLADSHLASRGLCVRAKTVDEKTRTVEATFSTEDPAQVMDWESWEVIDEVLTAEGFRIHGDRDQVPFLDAHQRYTAANIIGSGREIKPMEGKVKGRLHFGRGELAETYFQNVKEGHITDVSVGYRVIASQDIKPGETATVNGRTYTAGARVLRITTEWEIFEISLVPIGADAGATMRSANKTQGNQSPMKGVQMNEFLRKILVELGLIARDATDEQATQALAALDANSLATVQRKITQANAQLQPDGANPAAQPAPAAGEQRQAPAPIDLEAVREEARQQERKRLEAIDKATNLAGRGLVSTELIDQAKREAWPIEKFNQAVLDAIGQEGSRTAPVAPGIGINTGAQDHGQSERDILATVMLLRAGLDPLRKLSGERKAAMEVRMELADQKRWFSMFEMCRQALRLSRVNEPHDQESIVRAAVATNTLQYIFTTSVNAQLVAAYEETPNTAAGLVRRVGVNNYLVQERILGGQYSDLTIHPAGKTAQMGDISDDQETYKVYRFSSLMKIDEIDIINDRVDLLTSMPMKMGQAAGRVEPDLFYSLLLSNPTLNDGVALFASGHGNNSDTALSDTALQAAISALTTQTKDGANLNISAESLIVAAALEWTALELLKSTLIVVAGNSDTVRGNANTLQNRCKPVIESRLDNGVTDPITGTAYSGLATRWFLSGNPIQYPTIEMGYISGNGPDPRVRLAPPEAGFYGMGWDIAIDRGRGALDHRALYRGKST